MEAVMNWWMCYRTEAGHAEARGSRRRQPSQSQHLPDARRTGSPGCGSKRRDNDAAAHAGALCLTLPLGAPHTGAGHDRRRDLGAVRQRSGADVVGNPCATVARGGRFWCHGIRARSGRDAGIRRNRRHIVAVRSDEGVNQTFGTFSLARDTIGAVSHVVSVPGLASHRMEVTVPASRSLRLPVVRLERATYFRVKFVSAAGEPIIAPQLRRRSFDVSGNPMFDVLGDRISYSTRQRRRYHRRTVVARHHDAGA